MIEIATPMDLADQLDYQKDAVVSKTITRLMWFGLLENALGDVMSSTRS